MASHLVFRCRESFESGEGGHPVAIGEGTVWMASCERPAFGGYELAMLEEIDPAAGEFTGTTAVIRLSRLSTNFYKVPADDIVIGGDDDGDGGCDCCDNCKSKASKS